MPSWSKQLVESCIRVQRGTGFIVDRGAGQRVVLTAAHVVADAQTVRASWRSGSANLAVLASDQDTDVAVLSDDPGLDALSALSLSADPPVAGTPIAYAGYPSGWQDPIAVLQRGWVAVSSSDELWFDGNANPGNSGGPIVTHEEERLEVVGILLGRAGNVEQSLRDFATNMKKLHAQAQGFKSPMRFGDTDIIGNIAKITTGGLLDMANLMERHFRTGLVRAAGTDRLRRSLGT